MGMLEPQQAQLLRRYTYMYTYSLIWCSVCVCHVLCLVQDLRFVALFLFELGMEPAQCGRAGEGGDCHEEGGGEVARRK